MELEPKTTSKLVWWLLIPLGLLVAYIFGMAPVMALADRYEVIHPLRNTLRSMNDPIEAVASFSETTEKMERKYRTWWEKALEEPPPLVTRRPVGVRSWWE